MFERKPKRKGLKRLARVGAALVCGIVAFQLGGCVLERLNTEAKNRLNTKVDQFIAGDELTTDQHLVAQAVNAMNGGAYYEAEALLDSAVQINPSNTVALLNLGAVYEATDRLERARNIYAQLSDAAVRPVTGAGLAHNDVARLAATRLARLRAGLQTPNLRQAIWLKSQQGANAPSQNQAVAQAEIKTVPLPPPSTTKSDAKSPSKVAEKAAPKKSKSSNASVQKIATPKHVLVTLSSHPNEAEAKKDWSTLATEYADVIGPLTPTIKPIKQEGGKPDVFRLTTGPFASARDAATFCDRLLAHRVYCVISG
ncbi:MAG: hypothetical protein EXQ98_04845 [Alphaproteobacteria bacterium]|nr:hypothetical protein [Alphaproteobacteria bacterium]